MTDEEALKEIDRQEKRLAAAKCGRGLRLVGPVGSPVVRSVAGRLILDGGAYRALIRT